MSRIYRYQFTKKVFPNYIVFIVVKGKYITYENDLQILNYIKYKDKLKLLDKYKINYLVLDNLDIIIKNEFDNNQYLRYLYLVKLKKIVKSIGNNLVESSLL